MSSPIISVENLSKSYLVGHQSAKEEKYTTLRDVVGRNVKNFARKSWDMVRGRQIVQGDEIEEFWALKDVSFDVNKGEVVGIIGRNGAGKSTLLKVLSRITEPTKGRVTLRGRVASLLEVGTGFHPELSGRENIFLNGAILGMARSEIKRRFEEIVDFAEVEKFLDTPVKRYSSGMYVRLAFAVAAHLEPEILVVDEVLAVGDIEFQKKCMGKMKDVATGGRTVLFVSHNLTAIQSLCEKCIVLRGGVSQYFFETNDALAYYRQSRNRRRSFDPSSRSGSGKAKILNACFGDVENGEFFMSKPIELAIELIGNSDNRETISISIGIFNDSDVRISSSQSAHLNQTVKLAKGEKAIANCKINEIPLMPGDYYINLSLWSNSNECLDFIDNGLSFKVHASDLYGTGAKPYENQLIYLRPEWRITKTRTQHPKSPIR